MMQPTHAYSVIEQNPNIEETYNYGILNNIISK